MGSVSATIWWLCTGKRSRYGILYLHALIYGWIESLMGQIGKWDGSSCVEEGGSFGDMICGW